WWSFGGLFLVNSPEQRRMGIKDSKELAWQDWQGTATYDRQDDFWGKQWAKAYVDFATYEKRDWLYQKGVRIFPVVGWAERGGYLAEGHGNSVPRFHITWGTGPGIVEPFAREMKRYIEMGIVTFLPRHRVDSLVKENNRIAGIHGTVLETDTAARGEATNRNPVGEFTYFAQATVITTGGIGADFTTIRKNWPTRLGRAPQNMISGVPEHVDGRMLEIAENTGANLINRDRMWHYTEGIKNWNPIWKKHGIRILPGPSSMCLDALGNRFSATNLPGFDTLGTLETIMDTGYDYSWFILTKKVIEKEFALSGSEQNPDLTGKSIAKVLQRIKPGAPDPVQAFLDYGEDFVEADSIDNLVIKMNQLTGENRLDIDHVRRQVAARDRELINPFSKDIQITAMHGARRYVGDKLIRTAKPHAFLDRKNGPLIAVRLHILSRKTLGGLQTDLQSRVLKEDGT